MLTPCIGGLQVTHTVLNKGTSVKQQLHMCTWWDTLEEVEELVSVERWSCSRGASCVVEYTIGRLRDWSL